MRLDRRTLLIGGGVGVGLVVAFALWPGAPDSDLAVRPGERAFGNFIRIARDGRITVAVAQVETGQGIWTALPQIVADELGAAWDMIGVEPAPLTGAYANPLAKREGWFDGLGTLRSYRLGDAMRITAGSTSVRAFEAPLREAAAVARAMLVGAAADRWNVGVDECSVADGVVRMGARSATFGELAEDAAGRSPPRAPQLRQDAGARLFGQALPRLDGPAKVSGSWRLAGDVRLPGMLYAAAQMAPPGGRLRTVASDAARGLPGVRHVRATDDWVAVVADSGWAAERALAAANATFTAPETPADMRTLFDGALTTGESSDWFASGDYDAATADVRALAATYYAAPSQHLGLEPLSATARLDGETAEVWAASQAPQLAAGGHRFYPMPAGEPAGRAMESDAVAIAVALARELRRPVQVTLSQSASQNHDRVAPGAMARMTALLDPAGSVAAWQMRVATADGLGAALGRLAAADPADALGTTALDGSIPPYSLPNLRIQSVAAHLPLTAGYMRGSPQREFCFFTESFVDELARRAGQEPLAFRMAMLGGNGRLARCLQAAARLARWDGGGAGSLLGIAGCSAFGSHIGLVASASIGEDQGVRVERLVAAVDCGRVVNQGLVRQQIEAGLIWALAQATVSAPEWVSGMPRARAIGRLGLPRLASAPDIVVQVVRSSDAPGGVSGLGTTVLAPAVANAIFAGSGKRLRNLPFDPMAAA